MIKIGIPAQDQSDSKFGVNSNYLEFIYNIGRPVIILPENYDDFKQIYKLDALLLPGGADVNPKRYTKLPQFGTQNPNIWMEHFDTEILPNLAGKMPIFGICRGLQTLNVLYGGTLQNLWWHPYSNYETHTVHNLWKPEHFKDHDKKNVYISVNSFHHQGILNLAKNFRCELSDYDDNIVEAISDYRNKIFAVQWHPERLKDNYSINMFKSIL